MTIMWIYYILIQKTGAFYYEIIYNSYRSNVLFFVQESHLFGVIFVVFTENLVKINNQNSRALYIITPCLESAVSTISEISYRLCKSHKFVVSVLCVLIRQVLRRILAQEKFFWRLLLWQTKSTVLKVLFVSS